MTWLFRISAGLLVADLTLLTVWIAIRICFNPSSFSPTEVTPWIVAAGVLAALITLAVNNRREASEEYLENAIKLLSNAHQTLKNENVNGRPKNNRLNWLTAARLIKTAESVADLITVESHLRIWREQKEYWRGLFRDLINPNENGFPKEYYAAKPEDMLVWSASGQEPLSLTSLAVLYRFIRWPKDNQDPLKNEAPFTKQEIDEMERFGPKGLGELLKEMKQICSKNEPKI